MFEELNDYLNNGELIEEIVSADGKNTYMMPSRRNAGHIAILIIREIVAPTVFRNSEEEISDIEDLDGIRRVRATPSKFKFGERGRGLLVLRSYGVGGHLPQNRTAMGDRMPLSRAYDLNTLVFGDSAMQGNRILPVKAAIQYSDALSVAHYHDCVSESFHHRGDETGTLYDAEKKKNTDNLFTRHFITPGTLLVQVLSTNGRQLPVIGLDHLLLCLGLAGSYGGQTSVTGVNVRTHIAGIFASRFENPMSSPYELLKLIQQTTDARGNDYTVDSLASKITDAISSHYLVSIGVDKTGSYQNDLVAAFENDDHNLRQQYLDSAPKITELFERHFGT